MRQILDLTIPFHYCRIFRKLLQIVSADEDVWIRVPGISVDILHRVGIWKYIVIFPNGLLSITTYWRWCLHVLTSEYMYITHLGRGGSAQIGCEKFQKCCIFFGRQDRFNYSFYKEVSVHFLMLLICHTCSYYYFLQNIVQVLLTNTSSAWNMRGSPQKFLHIRLLMTLYIMLIDRLCSPRARRTPWY